ncbi:conserved hypothetical protein [Dinoroseobacter shibae DFL 12 = DSM 16493]|jgi:hypothetical protein|uniref:Uncharacterized protein n=1 Tax=Dinoroseobacter shibae (strain DSM 16493 / NCIMB 14021 / DFL 12) TaxID=398580 RepID=A8LL13_DINSH|nr:MULTISPECIES: hypothetical protein [Dinoroseobacter]ABV93377.1 conserved hypothetical protein [Dinoroseobacter shibae DFL 12 = DSM 16493]MDD9715528.1 hypothetical protein [Dinoroseobacter sp. PD6]URF48292.1 hypothetical protein M8008_08440 [Dinoroseobacter shibae]URF52602.1 hypothetical protein M8007_08440 [Dinoroseobacter shibae]
MSIIDDLADALAKDTLAEVARTGNEQLIVDVGRQLGASSSTMEEAYQTYIRVRQAEARARAFLEAQSAPRA